MILFWWHYFRNFLITFISFLEHIMKFDALFFSHIIWMYIFCLQNWRYTFFLWWIKSALITKYISISQYILSVNFIIFFLLFSLVLTKFSIFMLMILVFIVFLRVAKIIWGVYDIINNIFVNNSSFHLNKCLCISTLSGKINAKLGQFNWWSSLFVFGFIFLIDNLLRTKWSTRSNIFIVVILSLFFKLLFFFQLKICVSLWLFHFKFTINFII